MKQVIAQFTKEHKNPSGSTVRIRSLVFVCYEDKDGFFLLEDKGSKRINLTSDQVQKKFDKLSKVK